MNEFEAKSGLVFKNIDFNSESDKSLNAHYLNIVNSWRSKNINKFVLDTRAYGPLGNFFKDYSRLSLQNTFSPNAWYLIFDEKEVVGSTLLSFNSLLPASKELEQVVFKTENEDESYSPFTFQPKAYKNCGIEYYITNPKHLQKGYAKQAIDDICANMEIICNTPLNLIVTEINKLNKASVNLFEGRGFESTPSDTMFNYFFKFLEDKELE